VWQYGQFGVAGSGPNQLNTPVQNTWLPNFHVLITDQANERIIEVSLDRKIVWQYGMTGMTGTQFNLLNNPNSAELLANGNILIADENNNRAVEVDAKDTVVWEYATNTHTGSNANPLPTRAIRLRDGDTLISDQFNNRVIEVTPAKNIERTFGILNVSGYDTKTVNKGLNAPYDAKSVGAYTGLTPPFSFDF
jgi:hypothetical protein